MDFSTSRLGYQPALGWPQVIWTLSKKVAPKSHLLAPLLGMDSHDSCELCEKEAHSRAAYKTS